MDQEFSDSRLPILPWLDLILFSLDGVGLKQVSWADMYLEKPQCRAVSSNIASMGAFKRVMRKIMSK